MQPQFVHLRLHTEFSLVDGIVRIKPLVNRLTQLNMPAVAVTEQGNLFSLVKFYRATAASGIKTIVGADVYLYNPDEPTKPFLLTLLVNTQQGYITLTELISKAYQKGQHLGVPMLKESWLIENHEGLIALSGAMEGDIGQALLAGNIVLAQQRAQKWTILFKDSFYLELQRIGKTDEGRYLKAAVELATQLDLPVVATNNVRFLYQDDFAAHEVRVCINQGRVIDDDRRPKNYTDQQYLRSTEEMLALFADIPEALANTVEIAKRCNLELTLGKNYLPDFPVPEGMTLDEVFRQASKEGLNQRLQEVAPIGSGSFEENRKAYDARLQLELDVICQMGFPGYFMIVADFIHWAKKELIPVGPGRGSGAGSLVAYVLRITDLDPIEFDLLFERFLNPERVSMPDFDIDFCMERRDEVIDYVARHYGRDKVSQIITYGSMAAKAVIRDVGRVSGHAYGFVDRLAKLIPFEIGMTLEKALLATPELKDLYDTDEEVKALLDMGLSLEGISRNAGKHAGGVVISPTKLTDFTPLYCDESGSNLVTQFDKDDVEAVGLVKFDFLGLRTLTIIDWALQTINAEKKKQGEALVDITKIPRNDSATYKNIFQTAQTTAVFQLESRGMKELISKLKPDCFDDIIALVALYRPGPLESGMVDDYINVKHGAKAEYAHPILEPILQPTNGVILYQEQVMQIAREMAGYTLGGADMLRRAMGKKKPEEMAKQREIFTTGSIKNNIDESLATYVFDLISKFAGYGFNKTVDENTKIVTLNGIKLIKDCQTGDKVLSSTPTGDLVYSNIIALHDHGKVPLWEIEFDDGTIERCTLDHKWLTEQGQQPLWKIIQMGSSVWGNTAYTTNNEGTSKKLYGLSKQEKEISLGNKMWCGTTYQTRYSCPSKTMPYLHEHDSHRTFFWQEPNNVLWSGSTDSQKYQRTFESLYKMPTSSERHSNTNLQRSGTYCRNAGKIFTNSQKNFRTFRYNSTTVRSIEKMARKQSRRFQRYSSQSTCFSKTVQNGNVVRTAFDTIGFYSQYSISMPTRAKTNRLCSSSTENSYRSRWALAFPPYQFRRKTKSGASTRPTIKSRDSASILAINPSFDAMLQRQLWRTYFTRSESTYQANQRWQLGRNTVLRKPIRATFMGWHQGYDLEVDHSEHNFLLASGLCCSNSHSAAYALVAYQTAWLKAHYPAAFMAAVLSADMDNTDKVVMLIEECRQMKLDLSPPNVNVSNYRFTTDAPKKIVYGIGAIKGVGQSAIEDLIDERKQKGLFSGLYDLCKRVELRKVNRRVLEALIRAGAFDLFDDNRAGHFAELPIALRVAVQHGKMAITGQNDLFGLKVQTENENKGDESYSTQVEPWAERERLEGEKQTLGLYLTGHPINQYQQELKHFTQGNINKLLGDVERSRGKVEARVAGLVLEIRTRQTKKGSTMGFAVLDDRTGRLEVAAFSNTYEQYRDIFIKDTLLVAEGGLAMDDFSGMLRLTAEKMYSIEQARATFARCLAFEWHCPDANTDTLAFISIIREIIAPFKGGDCPLVIHYFSKEAATKLQLGEHWRVKATDELILRLQRCSYIKAVEVKYK